VTKLKRSREQSSHDLKWSAPTSRRLRRLAAAGIALTFLALPAAAAAAVQVRGVDASSYPTIRATVVTSKVSRTPPVVTENGRPVVGVTAATLANGTSTVLAIDRSQSMKGQPLAQAVAAARAFVQARPPGDRIAVTSFATSAKLLTSFSPDSSDALSALGAIRVDPQQGTTLYDDLVLASQKQSHSPFAGRVTIIVTDGNETQSKSSLEEAIAAARSARTSVYVIAIESPQFNPAPLQEIATQTGGRYFGTHSSAEIAGVYAAIAKELARTWRVEYVTAARPGDHIDVAASVPGEGSASARITVPGAPPTDAGPSKLVPKGAYGPTGPLGIAAVVAFLVLLATLFTFAGLRGSWVRSRISVHIGETRVTSKAARKEKRLEMLASVFKMTEKLFGKLAIWHRISKMLERADVPLRTVEFFWIEVAALIVAFVIGTIMGLAIPLVLLLAVVAGSIPYGIVWMKMRKRIRAFEDQLPDMLITIAASLKAGHSFKQGLQAVVDEGHPPANVEVKRVLMNASLGRPMDDALAEMADRVGSANFEFAITAVTIQRQVGGSLASLFDMVADTVRQRQQFARKIRALTAMGRMSAYTLIAVPFFIAGAVTVLNRSYMRPLYWTTAGHFLIVLGLVMMGLGSLVLKKIVSFRG
jgi:tight adherence protein B